jgi:hypothetical protein
MRVNANCRVHRLVLLCESHGALARGDIPACRDHGDNTRIRCAHDDGFPVIRELLVV